MIEQSNTILNKLKGTVTDVHILWEPGAIAKEIVSAVMLTLHTGESLYIRAEQNGINGSAYLTVSELSATKTDNTTVINEIPVIETIKN